MPFGIRPSNVRVCHSTTRAFECVKRAEFAAEPAPWQVSFGVTLAHARLVSSKIKSMSMSMSEQEDWIKVDLHIHTLDDPLDVLDYSAHQLLERAKQLGFGVLAITLHDAVFDRAEVFAAAAAMGILLIAAAEVRLEGADAI